MVEEIVCGHLPTDLRPFTPGEVLVQPGRKNVYAGTLDDAFAGCAELTWIGRREVAGIEPLCDRVRAVVRVAEDVRPYRNRGWVAGGIEDAHRIVAAPEGGQEHAGLRRIDTAEFPSSGDEVGQFRHVVTEMPPASNGDLVNEVTAEPVRWNFPRGPDFALAVERVLLDVYPIHVVAVTGPSPRTLEVQAPAELVQGR